jgi:hypothetical protein
MEARIRVRAASTNSGQSQPRIGREAAVLLFLCVLFLLVAYPLSMAQETSKLVSYDLKAMIQPRQGSIQVRGRIVVPVDNSDKTLQFGLHETFEVKKLRINGHSASFSFQPGDASPMFPATGKVLVNLPSSLAGSVTLEIEYGGTLKQIPEFGTYDGQKVALDDQINSRMVELASYSSWYPQFFVYGHPIDTTLEVSLPQGWIAICSGKKLSEEETPGGSVSRWSSAQNTDILITAAPNYKRKVIPAAGEQLEIYYTALPEMFVEKEGREIAAVLNLFTTELGETTISSGSVKHVFSPKRNGQGRAGISRPGMIVTSEGRVLGELKQDPNYSLFQDVAHEIAHFWWNFGAGQGDWINEAFAEYSSAVAVQQIQSEDQFQKILDHYRSEVRELAPDAPSLAKVPFDGSGFVIRYYKGSLMLDWIRSAMGSDPFYAAARDFFLTYKGKGIGTEEFRNFWKQGLGEKKNILDAWLDSTGGVPELGKIESARQ